MKILFLCTYPIGEPKHGGQLRARNIVDFYRRQGHDVCTIGVLGSGHYKKEQGFVNFPGYDRLRQVIANPFLMEDYAIGKIFSEQVDLYSKLASQITLTPDIIHVEQPWLFNFAKRYVQSNGSKSLLIYGSQNIEFKLKDSIVSSCLGSELGQSYSALIKDIEREAISFADAIVCVSETDQQWLTAQTDCPVHLAPNGVKPWRVAQQGLDDALKISGNHPYALYCASAHPPNITGFFDIFGNGFGSLNPDQRLIVAGGVGPAIARDSRFELSAKLKERCVIAEEVSQDCLEGLLDGAHCIVLPLTQGGGTNLKTAEALWAGKYIVATTVAMRGFENFTNAAGVFVTDKPPEFKRLLRAVMGKDSLVIDDQERERRQEVLWERCLRRLEKMLRSLTFHQRDHHA